MSDSECARVLLGIGRKAKISDAVNALIEENDGMRKRITELTVERDMQQSAATKRTAERDRVAKGHAELEARVHELERDKARLRSRLAAIVEWLEKNESSVFRRGLWDAINEVDAALERK